jgi:hypothetical protein
MELRAWEGGETIVVGARKYCDCNRGWCIEDALALFEDMKTEHIERNTVTYNTLITGLGRVGRMEDDQGGNATNKRESQICVNNEI